LEEFKLNRKTGKPTRIRIRGPSGSGKTKCCLDIARATTSIYIDWSRNDYDLSRLLQNVGDWKAESKKEILSKELLLIIVSRFLLRHHLISKCSFTAEDWLYYQLNGIGTMAISPLFAIQDYLRQQAQTENELISILTKFYGVSSQLIVIQDELNRLAHLYEGHFKNPFGQLRPLLSAVVLALYSWNEFDYISAGTGTIFAHKDHEQSISLKAYPERQVVFNTKEITSVFFTSIFLAFWTYDCHLNSGNFVRRMVCGYLIVLLMRSFLKP